MLRLESDQLASKKLASLASRFARDERGGITLLVLVMFLLLLVVGGMAVDYQRHEALRADLQDALDRGTLAATNLNQVYDLTTQSPKTPSEQARELVMTYMRSSSMGWENLNLNVAANITLNSRQVQATASADIPSIFIRIVGIDTMTSNVSSSAEHGYTKTEIVLALDVTQSMTRNSASGKTKLAELKIAANTFIDTVLNAGNPNTVISIVPFSQNVSLPPVVASNMKISSDHTYASCIDYSAFDFTTVGMELQPLAAHQQMQHFRETQYFDDEAGRRVYGCPSAKNAITPYSNNAGVLKAAIADLEIESYTAMYMGMKWASILLDPGSSAIVNSRIASTTDALPSRFAGFPNAWNDKDTQKIVVLMSDGRNTRLRGIRPFVYNNQTADYWDEQRPNSSWYQSVINNDSDGLGDTRLAEICAEVKKQPKAIVYTIGFELAEFPNAQAALLGCATDLTTYYLVEGVEISTAFKNIADDITNLKLVN